MPASLPRTRFARALRAVACAAALLPAAAVQAQAPRGSDLSALSLEELLDLTVISTASKFPQEVKEAPASITVVRADDIRRFGYRTLADVLRSVRGLYTTYDRNYAYLGIRGFARPGDYNTRFLLLLDGQRLNDGTFDMAPIGSDFPLDLTLVDRVEVIRGPGSSLYGTNAVFAVINVITKAPERQGLQVDLSGGSLATRSGTATFTQTLSRGRALSLSGSAYGSAGQRDLQYPELASEDGNITGLVRDLDHDASRQLFASFAAGGFTLRGGVGDRRKDVPTASYGTIVADGRESTRDTRVFVNAGYEGAVGRGWFAAAHLAYDQYDYTGRYPFALDTVGSDVEDDTATTRAVRGEVSVRRRVARVHQFTAGAEVRDLIESRQLTVASGFKDLIDAPSTDAGVYAQDEAWVTPWLLANIGVRVDHFTSFGARATPRVGLVWLPRKQTAVKLLHGLAFRAPNAYEMYYYPAQADFSLRPERIRSSELLWEEFLTSRIRTSVDYFNYEASDIIEQHRVDNDDVDSLHFANSGVVHGSGVGLEAEARLSSGVSARVSYTYARTRGLDSRHRLSNSPERLAKLTLQLPVLTWCAALDGQYVGPRLTLDRAALPGFFVANLALTSPEAKRVSVSLGVYNLFDERYADPGAEEHVQSAIEQDGRSALLRMRLKF